MEDPNITAPSLLDDLDDSYVIYARSKREDKWLVETTEGGVTLYRVGDLHEATPYTTKQAACCALVAAERNASFFFRGEVSRYADISEETRRAAQNHQVSVASQFKKGELLGRLRKVYDQYTAKQAEKERRIRRKHLEACEKIYNNIVQSLFAAVGNHQTSIEVHTPLPVEVSDRLRAEGLHLYAQDLDGASTTRIVIPVERKEAST